MTAETTGWRWWCAWFWRGWFCDPGVDVDPETQRLTCKRCGYVFPKLR